MNIRSGVSVKGNTAVFQTADSGSIPTTPLRMVVGDPIHEMIHCACGNKKVYGLGLCNPCWQKYYYWKNPSKKRAKRKAYYARNRQKELEYQFQKYRERHPDASTTKRDQ